MNDELPGLFRLAKNISKHSDYKIKVGAVLCDKKSHVLSVGFNKIKTHPEYGNSWKPTIHAEMSAIISSGRRNLEDYIMFVYREDKAGNPANARPCEDCLTTMRFLGIKRIWYTTSIYPFFNTEKIK